MIATIPDGSKVGSELANKVKNLCLVCTTAVFTSCGLFCCSRTSTDGAHPVWYRGLHRHAVDAEPRPQLPVVVVRSRRRLWLLLRLREYRTRQLHPHHSTRVPRTGRQDAANRHERFGAVVKRDTERTLF